MGDEGSLVILGKLIYCKVGRVGRPREGMEICMGLYPRGRSDQYPERMEHMMIGRGGLSPKFEGIFVEYSQNIDVKSLLSGLQGTDVVLKITAIIPESATGPSKAMIDAVSFMATETLVGVDENNSNMEVSIFPNPIVNTLNLATSFEVNQVVIYDLI